MHAKRIRLPVDFREFAEGHDSIGPTFLLVSPSPDIERALRAATDAIFDADFGICMGDPDLLPSFLNTVEEPLDAIREAGHQLFALQTTGEVTLPESVGGQKIAKWRRTFFLVAPLPCFFRVERPEPPQALVHMLDPNCAEAMGEIPRAHTREFKLRFWNAAAPVHQLYERAAPWCQTCCLAEALGIPGPNVP